MNASSKYGLIGGGVCIAFMLGVYFYSNAFLDKQWMVHFKVNLSKYLIFAFFMYLSLSAFLKGQSEILPIKELIRAGFICFLIANLIYHAFYFTMLNWIDTDLIAASNEFINDYMEKLNQTRVPGRLEETKPRIEKISLSSSLFAYAKEVIFCLLYTSPSPRDATLSRMPSSA